MPTRRHRKNSKIEALVVNALRRLQDVQGSSSREISNYISQEYDVPAKDVKRQVQIALKRALSYGILRRSNGGYYTCNSDYIGQLPLGIGEGDRVMEPCHPSQSRYRFIWRARRARRERAKKRRERRKREEAKKRRRARGRRKGRGRSRRRRRSRRGRTRRGRSRTRSRRRRRTGGRSRSRAGPSEMEMEEMTLERKRNDIAESRNCQKSESSISEYSNEQHLRDSPPQNS